MPIKPRSILLNMPQAHHGAFDFAELEHLGLRSEEIIDFSANINPYGPSPAVQKVLEKTNYKAYPDRESLVLRRALASHLDISAERIMVGNGTAELLWLTAFAYIRPNDRVLILAPTFGEYERVSRLMDARVSSYQANARSGFAVEITEVSQRLHNADYRIVFLCSPNNPTGRILPLDALSTWAGAYPETLFVVDEAYLPFADGAVSALSLELENLLVMRSMTKDYAIAGLRLGYAVGAPSVIGALRASRPPWNVNALAQAAGVAALQDGEYLQSTLAKIRANKKEFVRELKALELQVLPSETHYFLINVGNGKSFRSKLLQEGVQVRDCASFGLPEYVRLATRLPEENERLLKALRNLATVE